MPHSSYIGFQEDFMDGPPSSQVAKIHAVLSVYRSPNTCCTAAITELQSILMQLLPHVKYIIVAGDFNIDLKSNLPISKEYRNLLDDFCLTQHISEPSRVSRGSATLIDHISSSNQLPVVHSCQAVGISDHCIQCVDFEVLIYILRKLDQCGSAHSENVTGISCVRP